MNARPATIRGFTLIELLIVVAIIAILAAIAVVNFQEASERAERSADAANLHTVATALQLYTVDYNRLPPADREAGPFPSHLGNFTQPRNGPASGGSLDGLPWILYELGYLGDWRALFTPKYLKQYAGGQTHRGGWPRYHNFRYAYNSAALPQGTGGGFGNVQSGEVWIVRNLWRSAEQGWWADDYPEYPADYDYPHGPAVRIDNQPHRLEHVLYADMAVRLVVGGTDDPADQHPIY